MTVNTLDFTGDATTTTGLVGLVFTLLVLVAVFSSFYNSPLNK